MPTPSESETQRPGEKGDDRPWSRRAGAACLFLGSLGLFAAASGAVLARSLSGVETGSEVLGNFRARIDTAVARAVSPPFRFGVLGDVRHGTRALLDQLAYLKRRGDIAFAVQTGDLVRDDDAAPFEAVVATLREVDPGFPILVVPSDAGSNDGGAAFRTFAGPREVAFVAAGTLFVIADNASGPLVGERLAFVEAAFRRHRPDVRRIVVFLHRPPIAFAAQGVLSPTGEDAAFIAAHEEFRRMANQFRVDRVFCGHARGYHVVEEGGVTYSVTGLGGDPREVGVANSQDASLVEVEVAADGLRVSRVTVAAGPSPGGLAKYLSYAWGRPLFAAWGGRVAWASVALLVIGFVLTVRLDSQGAKVSTRGSNRHARSSRGHGASSTSGVGVTGGGTPT